MGHPGHGSESRVPLLLRSRLKLDVVVQTTLPVRAVRGGAMKERGARIRVLVGSVCWLVARHHAVGYTPYDYMKRARYLVWALRYTRSVQSLFSCSALLVAPVASELSPQ